MAREPDDRFQSAPALREALLAWIGQKRRVGNLVADFLDDAKPQTPRPRGTPLARVTTRSLVEPPDEPKKVAEGFDVTVHDESPFGASVEPGPVEPAARPPSDFASTVGAPREPPTEEAPKAAPTPLLVASDAVRAVPGRPAKGPSSRRRARQRRGAPAWVGLLAVVFFVVGGLLLVWSVVRR